VSTFDVVVCGLGAMGSATVYQLAKRGLRVLGIDSYAPPHALGSTHGETRITRQAIGEGLAYVPLARRSHELWREIEQETGADLLTTSGVLIMASPGEHVHHHGKTGFLETTIDAARAFSIEHEVLSAAEITARFPQFLLTGDESGYFEPSGGFLRPEVAVAAQLQLASRHGAVIHSNEPIAGYVQAGGGVTVTTTSGARYDAGALVLAVGPWVGEMLGDPYAGLFSISRQLLHWYALAGPLDDYVPGRFPVFIWDDHGSGFYGFPAVEGAIGGVKVAAETSVSSATVDDVRRGVSAAEHFELYDSVITHRIRGLARECIRVVSCIYTTTPDGDFIVDRHPEHRSVMVVSACSGHGFKHSAALGEAVAAEIAGDGPRVDLTPFRFDRLRV
jgi:sarcosine oxidase